MVYFSFAEKLSTGGKIKIFNYGNCQRDFIFVDDESVKTYPLLFDRDTLLHYNNSEVMT